MSLRRFGLNIDQYFALHVTGLDAKVAYKTYVQERASFEAMLEDLQAHGDQAVSAAYLGEALKVVSRLHNAHLEAVAALVFEKK